MFTYCLFNRTIAYANIYINKYGQGVGILFRSYKFLDATTKY